MLCGRSGNWLVGVAKHRSCNCVTTWPAGVHDRTSCLTCSVYSYLQDAPALVCSAIIHGCSPSAAWLCTVYVRLPPQLACSSHALGRAAAAGSATVRCVVPISGTPPPCCPMLHYSTSHCTDCRTQRLAAGSCLRIISCNATLALHCCSRILAPLSAVGVSHR